MNKIVLLLLLCIASALSEQQAISQDTKTGLRVTLQTPRISLIAGAFMSSITNFTFPLMQPTPLPNFESQNPQINLTNIQIYPLYNSSGSLTQVNNGLQISWTQFSGNITWDLVWNKTHTLSGYTILESSTITFSVIFSEVDGKLIVNFNDSSLTSPTFTYTNYSLPAPFQEALNQSISQVITTHFANNFTYSLTTNVAARIEELWLNGGLTLIPIGDHNVTIALNLTSPPIFNSTVIQLEFLGDIYISGFNFPLCTKKPLPEYNSSYVFEVYFDNSILDCLINTGYSNNYFVQTFKDFVTKYLGGTLVDLDLLEKPLFQVLTGNRFSLGLGTELDFFSKVLGDYKKAFAMQANFSISVLLNPIFDPTNGFSVKLGANFTNEGHNFTYIGSIPQRYADQMKNYNWNTIVQKINEYLQQIPPSWSPNLPANVQSLITTLLNVFSNIYYESTQDYFRIISVPSDQ